MRLRGAREQRTSLFERERPPRLVLRFAVVLSLSLGVASALILVIVRVHATGQAERAAIVQCYHNDLSHEEAAYVLGCPVGTVKTHVLRGKQKLARALAAWAARAAP